MYNYVGTYIHCIHRSHTVESARICTCMTHTCMACTYQITYIGVIQVLHYPHFPEELGEGMKVKVHSPCSVGTKPKYTYPSL